MVQIFKKYQNEADSINKAAWCAFGAGSGHPKLKRTMFVEAVFQSRLSGTRVDSPQLAAR